MWPYVILALGSIAWFAPLLIQRRKGSPPQKTNPLARWGVLLVGAAYAVPWPTAFWTRSPGSSRTVVATVCLLIACVFSWTAARALGKHWRIEAGLDPDHELVQSGVYGIVRHPIYTSMLLVIAATCLVLAPLYLLPVSLLLYVAGTGIRVRAEEALLADRFGEAFAQYQSRVPAYVPHLKR
jgi:protein-S-isoprenylcysteine O-methyltransferase Ste14